MFNVIMAVIAGICMGTVFCWFGEVVTPNDLV